MKNSNDRSERSPGPAEGGTLRQEQPGCIVEAMRRHFDRPCDTCAANRLMAALDPALRRIASYAARGKQARFRDEVSQDALIRLFKNATFLGDATLAGLLSSGSTAEEEVRKRIWQTLNVAVRFSLADACRIERGEARFVPLDENGRLPSGATPEPLRSGPRHDPSSRLSHKELLKMAAELDWGDRRNRTAIRRVFELGETAEEAGKHAGLGRSSAYRALKRAKERLQKEI